MRSPTNYQHSSVALLGAICGSARSMDRAAQSMDPYFAQESVDRAVRFMNVAYDII